MRSGNGSRIRFAASDQPFDLLSFVFAHFDHGDTPSAHEYSHFPKYYPI
jgi:hypothetical protein